MPSVPISRAQAKTAFPAAFMIFAANIIFIGSLEFPSVRKMAAQAPYMARKGIEAAQTVR